MDIQELEVTGKLREITGNNATCVTGGTFVACFSSL